MVYIPNPHAFSSFDQKVKQLNDGGPGGIVAVREIRNACDDSGVFTVFNNPGLAVLFLIICLVLLLLALGVVKGLLGLYCCPPVGMCGLGALIDLPRPLEGYQEPELSEFRVKYDVIGWPVHPQTGKRTVRALSLRTEFCLNVIFFLTYPLIMFLTLLSLCCFQQVYDTEDTEKYKQTHTIMLTDCPSVICKKHRFSGTGGPSSKKKMHIYNDNDSTEEADTKYVLEQMAKSQETLRQSH